MIAVAIEATSKRVFASAIDWPGWTRAGRTETDALAALAAYADRYRAAAGRAAHAEVADDATFKVVERLSGNATTDFGAPGAIPDADRRPLVGADLERWGACLRASWAALDRAARRAEGIELRRGPRGGGRDLGKILAHVFAAEVSYLSQLGARFRGDNSDALHEAVLAALDGPTDGRWPPRYFIRRAAWHVLDHTWEIEDRAAPER